MKLAAHISQLYFVLNSSAMKYIVISRLMNVIKAQQTVRFLSVQRESPKPGFS